MIRVVGGYVYAMRYTIPVLILGLFPALAHAAAVLMKPVDWEANPDEQVVTIKVFSSIEDGDLDRVRQAFAKARKGDRRVLALEMESDGGDGYTGMQLAQYVADHNVSVLLRERCWSACSYAAMVALGQGRLLIRDQAEIGVHQARDTGDGSASRGWTQMTANQLLQLGAPADMLDAMVETPPSGMTRYSYFTLKYKGAIAMPGQSWWSWE